MHVARITGTVKGKVEANLGPKTIIVGPNGSGKTRIQNTLELALLGYATDVVGRAEMRKESDLITLAAGDDLIAEATLSDGRVSSWSTKRTKTGAKKAEHVRAVNAYFPVQDVRGALTGSVETARKWLLQRISGSVQRSDITRYFTGETTERYEKKAKLVSGDEVSILVAVLESARSEKRSKNAELTSIERTLAALGNGLGPEPMASQIEEAEQTYKLAMDVYAAAIRDGAANTRESAETLRQRAEAAIAEYEEAAKELNELLPYVEQFGGPLTEQENELSFVRLTLSEAARVHAQHGITTCLLCESGATFDPSAREHVLTEANKDAAIRNRLNGRIASLRPKADELLRKANALIADFNSANSGLPDFASPGTTVDEARAAMESASERLNAMKNAASAHRDLRSYKDQERSLKRDVRFAENMAEECAEAVGSLLKTATADFIKKVQSYLPETDVFDLVLNDDDKEVCRFGFVRDSNLHTALSGAEWARLTLALACAANKPSADTLLVFTPEERAFDPHTLRNVLVALTDAPGQVILCSPVKPAGKLPKGWTLVETAPTE